MKLKKALCVFLFVAIISVFCIPQPISAKEKSLTSTFSVNASEIEKYTNRLKMVLEDDTIVIVPLYISLKPVVNEEKIEKIVSEKYSWNSEQEHLRYYRLEVKNKVTEYVQQFIDDNSDLIVDIITRPTYVEFIIANVEKENVTELAKLDIVEQLDCILDEEPDDIGLENVYYDSFLKWAKENNKMPIYYEDFTYNELYYHKTDGITDWALVKASFNVEESPKEVELSIGNAGGRKIKSDSIQNPFDTGYGIYDKSEDRFYSLNEIANSYEKYDGLIEALAKENVGFLSGDTDNNNVVDILDATNIQKWSVEKIKLSEDQLFASDVNNDLKVDVLDAVAIQKYTVL